jgi:hypothetical protein
MAAATPLISVPFAMLGRLLGKFVHNRVRAQVLHADIDN